MLIALWEGLYCSFKYVADEMRHSETIKKKPEVKIKSLKFNFWLNPKHPLLLKFIGNNLHKFYFTTDCNLLQVYHQEENLRKTCPPVYIVDYRDSFRWIACSGRYISRWEVFLSPCVPKKTDLEQKHPRKSSSSCAAWTKKFFFLTHRYRSRAEGLNSSVNPNPADLSPSA